MLPPIWRPDVDLKQPSVARVYDYILGGAHNFAIDREIARSAFLVHPAVRELVYASRAFLRRAVEFCLSAGVRQFVDLGSGLPTAGNVHEVAHRIDPNARVLYVDHDPAAVVHSQAMLAALSTVEMAHADAVDPDQVLRGDLATRLLDFAAPIALCAVGSLEYLSPREHPGDLLAKYRSMLPAGSYLVLSHQLDEPVADQDFADLLEFAGSQGWPIHRRSREEIETLFRGLDVVSPGLVPVPKWRPDSADSDVEPDAALATLAGVGRMV